MPQWITNACWLQVEINTIAASFACLSALTTRLHRYAASRLPPDSPLALDPARLPDNPTLDTLPDAIAAAARAHGAPGGVVVMVVQPGERNAYDQQWLALRLWERHGLRVLRRSLAQVDAFARVAGDGTCSLEEEGGSHVVSVFYFRCVGCGGLRGGQGLLKLSS